WEAADKVRYSALFLAPFVAAVGALATAFFAALAAFFSVFGFTALGAGSLSCCLGSAFLAAFFAAGFLKRPPPPLAARSAISPMAWSRVMESGARSFGMVALILPHFT